MSCRNDDLESKLTRRHCIALAGIINTRIFMRVFARADFHTHFRPRADFDMIANCHNPHSHGDPGLVVGTSAWLQRRVQLRPQRRGAHLVTEELMAAVPEVARFHAGLLHLQGQAVF